jgi:hypothetical protein
MRLDVKLQSFLISALDGVSGQLHETAALSLRKSPPPRAHRIEGWVGPRSRLNALEKKFRPGRGHEDTEGK